MIVHSVKIEPSISGRTIVLRDENGELIEDCLISDEGIESIRQLCADEVFGSQAEQTPFHNLELSDEDKLQIDRFYAEAGQALPGSGEYGDLLFKAFTELSRALYKPPATVHELHPASDSIGRGDLDAS